MENRLGFSCFGSSLFFCRLLLLRPNPNDVDRRGSTDRRGGLSEDVIAVFMLVGGYFFSVGSFSDRGWGCDRPNSEPDLARTVPSVVERLCPRARSRCADRDGAWMVC